MQFKGTNGVGEGRVLVPLAPRGLADTSCVQETGGKWGKVVRDVGLVCNDR